MDAQTWIALGGLAVAFATLLLAVAGVFARKIESHAIERRSATTELHRRIDEVQAALASFQRHVPETYATIAYLKDVEHRMTTIVKESEGRLALDIQQSEDRLGKRFDRIEGKIDRLPVGGE